MERHTRHRAFLPCVFIALCALPAGGFAGDAGTTIGRTTEKEVRVVLSASFGKVTVEKGEPEKIFHAEGRDNHSNIPTLVTDYAVRNRVGYLDISLGSGAKETKDRKSSFKLSEFTGGDWRLAFTDVIPVSFDIELGVAKGRFDMTGLMVKDFNLSCGASDVVLTFDEPNTATIEVLNIECGVSKFEGRKLGNANFKRFLFQGGVGTATLDFSGELRSEVDVDIELSVGVCTIVIPEAVGVRVFSADSPISRISLDKGLYEEAEGRYLSENFKSAAARMNVRVEAGLGSISVKRK